MQSTCYSCQISIKFEYFQQIFDKYSNITFLDKRTSERRVVPCGRRMDRQKDRQADRHDEDNGGFLNFANAPKSKEVMQNI